MRAGGVAVGVVGAAHAEPAGVGGGGDELRRSWRSVRGRPRQFIEMKLNKSVLDLG